MIKKNKTLKERDTTTYSWENDWVYGVNQYADRKPKPNNLWYLAISISIVICGFLSIILIS